MTYQSQSNAFGLTGLSARGLNNNSSHGMQLPTSQSMNVLSNTYTTTHNDVSYQTRLTLPMIKQKLIELIEYLRLHHRYYQQAAATSTDIFKAIHIDINSAESAEFIAECKKNNKIVVEDITQTNNKHTYLMYYKPFYPHHRTRDSLLELIRSQKMGVDTVNLLDSYLEAGNDLQWLYDNNYIIILAGNRKDKIKPVTNNDTDIIQNNDLQQNNTIGTHNEYIHQILQSGVTGKNISHLHSRCYIRNHNNLVVDNEIKQLWHSIKLPSDPAELEQALAKAGYLDIDEIRTGYVDKTRRAALIKKHKLHQQEEALKRKRKEERDKKKGNTTFRKNQKITNIHLVKQLPWLSSAVNGGG